MEKRMLSMQEIEAQTALELPDRETPDTVIVTCLAICVGQIRFRDVNVAVANNICLAVQDLNLALIALFVGDLGDTTNVLACEQKVQQGGGNGGGNGKF